MTNVSDDQIIGTLAPYGFHPNQAQCDAITTYIYLLFEWNRLISLTTVVDPVEILRFHFGESVYASACVPILNGRLADLGSGAGFPGLPLQIAHPDLSLTMIESNTKRAAFLREVIQELKIGDAAVVRERIENVPSASNQYDFITARALGNHARTLRWARPRLSPGGNIVLWLGEEDAFAMAADSSWRWGEAARIPGSQRRFILVGSPT